MELCSGGTKQATRHLGIGCSSSLCRLLKK